VAQGHLRLPRLLALGFTLALPFALAVPTPFGFDRRGPEDAGNAAEHDEADDEAPA
jgi:hypothetical protein